MSWLAGGAGGQGAGSVLGSALTSAASQGGGKQDDLMKPDAGMFGESSMFGPPPSQPETGGLSTLIQKAVAEQQRQTLAQPISKTTPPTTPQPQQQQRELPSLYSLISKVRF